MGRTRSAGRPAKTYAAVPETAPSDPEEYGYILQTLRNTIADDPQRWTRTADRIKGVTWQAKVKSLNTVEYSF